METLPTLLEVRGEDGQRGHQLLPNPKKLSPKQARWQDFLDEFDYVLEYKPRKINLIADALSRKSKFAAMLSHPQNSLLDRIKEGLAYDPRPRT